MAVNRRGVPHCANKKVEKIIPTYVQGTVMPEISDLMNRSRESSNIGMLFKFQGSLEYGFSGCVSRFGIALCNHVNNR